MQVACRLLEVLTSSDNGKDLLFQHKLLGEIAEQLKFELDNVKISFLKIVFNFLFFLERSK